MKVTHIIGVWTIIVVLFAHTLGINMLYELYAVDKTFFVELFCVNQEKPEMQCEGACMLSKMDKQHQKDSDKPARTEIAHLPLIFCFQNEEIDFESFIQNKTIRMFPYRKSYDSQYQDNIFRPPILV